MYPNSLSLPNAKVYIPEIHLPPESTLYRVLEDGRQNPHPDRKWLQDSGTVARQLPAVNPMRAENYNGVITDRSGEVRTHLPQAWLDFFASLNTEHGARYLFKADSGLFNDGVEKGLEQLLMAGNIVNVPEQRFSDGKMWGRIDTYDVTVPPPSVPISYRKQRFTVIKDDLMTLVDPPPGPIYWVLVSYVPVWFAMSKLEKV